MADVFHHVSIYVMAYDRSVQFYQALGFKLFTAWEADGRHCFMSLGGYPCLELNESNAASLSENRIKHFCIHVDDVDAVYACALAHGATGKVEPHVHPLASAPIPITEAKVAHIYGPDGESVEIINWGSLYDRIAEGAYR